MVSPIFCPPYNDLRPADIPHIKGVHGLAGFQHHEVGDVDNVVNGAHPGALDAALHPVRGFLNPQVATARPIYLGQRS